MTPEQGVWTDAEIARLIKLKRNEVSYLYCAAQIEGRSAAACKEKWRALVASGLAAPARPSAPKPAKAPKAPKTYGEFEGLIVHKRSITVIDRSIPGHAGPEVVVSVAERVEWRPGA